jgi:hypothetical protein
MFFGSYNNDRANRKPRRDNVEELKGQMEGLTRLYQQLDQKISPAGGVQNLFGLNRKIREVLQTITIAELDNILNEIHRTKESLNQLQEDVIEIRVLKEVMSSPTARQINGETPQYTT